VPTIVIEAVVPASIVEPSVALPRREKANPVTDVETHAELGVATTVRDPEVGERPAIDVPVHLTAVVEGRPDHDRVGESPTA